MTDDSNPIKAPLPYTTKVHVAILDTAEQLFIAAKEIDDPEIQQILFNIGQAFGMLAENLKKWNQ